MSKKLKKKAWALFSKYIRLRDADKDGICTCVTCGKRSPWNIGMQAGHFVDSRCNSVLFREDLVYSQCVACNMFKKGNKVAYTLFMLKQGHTEEDIEGFLRLKNTVKKITDDDYLEMIEDLKDKLVTLDIRRGEYER